MKKAARNASFAILALAVVVVAVMIFTGKGPFSRNAPGVTHARGDTLIIDGTNPTCAECSLDVSAPLRLGSTSDRDIPQRVPDVVRDSRGTHYLVFNGWSDKPILRYDSTGKYIGKLGSTGRGPGEYTMSHTVFIGPRDSVFLYDWNQRLQVYDADGNFARVVSRIRASLASHLKDSSGLMFARPPYEEKLEHGQRVIQVSDYVHVVDSEGNRVDSMKVNTLGAFGRPMWTAGANGDIWTYGTTANYRLEQIDRSGRVKRVIGVALPGRVPLVMNRVQAESVVMVRGRPSRMVIGARPVSKAQSPSDSRAPGRPSPSQSMLVDSAGLLWMLRSDAAPGWDTLLVTPEHLSPDEAPGETTIPRDQEDRLYHTVIEVIDPVRGQILARTTLPFLGMWAAPGYVARVTADAQGHYITEVYTLRLNTAARR